MAIEWQIEDSSGLVEEPADYTPPGSGWLEYKYTNIHATSTATDVGLILLPSTINVGVDTIDYPSTLGFLNDEYDVRGWNENDPTEGLFITFKTTATVSAPASPFTDIVGVNRTTCVPGSPILWEDPGTPGNYNIGPGEFFSLWVYVIPPTISARRLYFSFELVHGEML